MIGLLALAEAAANDVHGHAAGDECLKQFATRFASRSAYRSWRRAARRRRHYDSPIRICTRRSIGPALIGSVGGLGVGAGPHLDCARAHIQAIMPAR